MSKVSSLRKLGIVARVARNQAGRSRTLQAAWSAARTAARSTGHVLHLLWLEVTGTVFLALAVFGAMAGIREYTKYTAGHASGGRVAIAIGFTITFGWFGLSSFWRVRRKNPRL